MFGQAQGPVPTQLPFAFHPRNPRHPFNPRSVFGVWAGFVYSPGRLLAANQSLQFCQCPARINRLGGDQNALAQIARLIACDNGGGGVEQRDVARRAFRAF